MTVSELKNLIKNWPDKDALGRDTTAWVHDQCGDYVEIKKMYPLLDGGDLVLDIANGGCNSDF